MNEMESRERLIRMEAKLDSHLYRTTQAEIRLDAHDTRIRGLETGFAKTMGVAAGVSALFTGAAAWASKVFGH